MVKSKDMRRIYSKLKLERVSLVPGEAVLGSCKTATLGGGVGLFGGTGNCSLATPTPCSATTSSS